MLGFGSPYASSPASRACFGKAQDGRLEPRRILSDISNTPLSLRSTHPGNLGEKRSQLDPVTPARRSGSQTFAVFEDAVPAAHGREDPPQAPCGFHFGGQPALDDFVTPARERQELSTCVDGPDGFGSPQTLAETMLQAARAHHMEAERQAAMIRVDSWQMASLEHKHSPRSASPQWPRAQEVGIPSPLSPLSLPSISPVDVDVDMMDVEAEIATNGIAALYTQSSLPAQDRLM